MKKLQHAELKANAINCSLVRFDPHGILDQIEPMSNEGNILRIGQLCGLVSKPELNGLYVVLETYSAKKGRYGVKTLVPPNSTVDSVSILVKLANIKFPQADTFSSKFPNARTQPGNSVVNTYSDGTILDFSDVRWEQKEGSATESRTLQFSNSCLILGTTSTADSDGQRLTRFPEHMILAAGGLNKYMEVVNINFTDREVTCILGVHTTFRNCRFSGKEGCGFGGQGFTMDIYMESCVFEGNSTWGALISADTKVSFYNCTFRKCHIAVHIVEGGSAYFAHCAFVDCYHGINVAAKATKIEVVNCSFHQQHVAMYVENGGVTEVRGSLIEGCVSAIVVEGPKTTVFTVEDCVIRECRMGLTAATGKVKLTLHNTEITRQTFFGLRLANNLLGTVNVSNCTINDNEMIDVMNCCGPACPVVINDELQRSDDQGARCALYQPLNQQVNDWEKTVTENIEPFQHSLKRLRTCKQAGTGYVKCAHCPVCEPVNVKFKACGKCKNVVYCSKDCQVAHWIEHRNVCGTIKYQ